MASEEKIRIAYLGPEGTFTQQASIALNRDVRNPQWVEHSTIDGVIDSVAQGGCERAVVPLRTHYGDVYDTLDKMREMIVLSEAGEARRIYITGYGEMPIRFYLAAKRGTKLEDVRVIATKQQALEACSKDLKKLLNGQYAAQHLASTALGARMVAESPENSIAALCSEEAVQEYNLVPLLSEPISRVTAFIRISASPSDMFWHASGGMAETALMIRLYDDKPGQLHSITGAILPVNMTDIHLMKNKEDDYGIARAVFIVRIAAGNEWSGKVLASLNAEFGKGEYGRSRVDNLGTYPIIKM